MFRQTLVPSVLQLLPPSGTRMCATRGLDYCIAVGRCLLPACQQVACHLFPPSLVIIVAVTLFASIPLRVASPNRQAGS